MSFAEDLEYGKKGEQLVRHILESSQKFSAIWDCSDDKYFQGKDIDILALAMDGHIAKYEVKTDRQAHKTGNIAYETKTGGGGLGCLEKTECDFIMYYTAGNGRLYCMETKKIREYIAKKRPKRIRMGDNALGYLLEIKDLIKERRIVRVL